MELEKHLDSEINLLRAENILNGIPWVTLGNIFLRDDQTNGLNKNI